jgi:hypothetical protein
MCEVNDPPGGIGCGSLRSGQPVWAGCGSEFIQWGTLSWFRKVTQPPPGTETSRGVGPDGVIVMTTGAPTHAADVSGGALVTVTDPPHV